MQLTRRFCLTLGTGLLLLLGIGLGSIPFLTSLQPSQDTLNAREIAIPLTSIPEGRFLEVDWEWGQAKVFLRRQGTALQAFWIPFRNWGYQIPDLTWDRIAIYCHAFGFVNNRFCCLDQGETAPHWAQRDDTGQASHPHLPALCVPPFVVEGKVLMLGKRR